MSPDPVTPVPADHVVFAFPMPMVLETNPPPAQFENGSAIANAPSAQNSAAATATTAMVR